MKRLLTTIILSILSITTISTSIYAKNYEVIEVENDKEITFNTLVKLYEKADYTIYLNNKKLNGEVLNKESNLNNTYYYIGYTEDNEHFFEYFTKETETVKESETVKETEKPTETIKETQATTQKPKETTAKKETEKKEIAPSEKAGNYIITVGYLNIREKPDTKNSKVVGSLKRNTVVNVIGFYDSYWAIIEYKGKNAYIGTKYIKSTTENVTPTEKQETKKVETQKPKDIAPAETQSKQPVQTTQVPQSSSTIQTQSGIKLDKNAWLSVYSNKIYSARELVKIVKNLSNDTIINISSVAQRQTFEYTVNDINEDILNELARREGKTNFKISPNASQDNCIYITITEYSQLN